MSGAIVFEKAVQEDLDIGVGQVDVTNPGGGTVRGTRVNLQSLAFYSALAVIAWGTVQPSSFVSFNISVPGVRKGDFVQVSYDLDLAGLLFIRGYVSSDDVVTVVIQNIGSIPANAGSGNTRVMVFKTNL
jgi:hypothetical protein